MSEVLQPTKRALLAAFLFAPLGQVLASSALTLEEVAASLHRPALLSAGFDLVKKTAALTGALTAKGYFLLAADGRLLWVTQEPYDDVLGFSKAKVGAMDDAGRWQVKPNAYLSQVQSLVDQFLAGDRSELEKMFFLTVSGSREHWSILATPRAQNLSARLTEVLVRGGAHIEGLRIVDPQGTMTDIMFHGVQENPSVTEADQSYLDSLR